NFDKNVAKVASQTCFVVFSPDDSCDKCTPKESERASAIAIVKIPPITAALDWVLTPRPIKSPRVVKTPETNPKLIPALYDFFMLFSGLSPERAEPSYLTKTMALGRLLPGPTK